jgi:endonuclease/exonuclease/phosphatase family metal-dependent hydrolase
MILVVLFCLWLSVSVDAQLQLLSSNTVLSRWIATPADRVRDALLRLLSTEHALSCDAASLGATVELRTVELSDGSGHPVRFMTPDGPSSVSFGSQLRFSARCGEQRHEFLAMRDPSGHDGLLQRRAPDAVSPIASVGARLRVMCFNVFNFNAPWGERLQLIADRVVDARADVVMLQEVRYASAFVNGDSELRRSRFQLAHLLAALRARGSDGWQFVHAPAMYYLNSAAQHVAFDIEGVAILSRAPIVQVDVLPLSRNPRDTGDEPHQRVVLRARVATRDGGAVDFFTTHFSLSESAQLRAVHEIMKWVRAHEARDPHVPQVFGGDLNALPSATSIRTLVGDVGAAERGDFQDAWSARLQQAPPASDVNQSDASFGATFPTLGQRPFKRIDYILVRNVDELRVHAFDVVPDAGVPDTLVTSYERAPDGSVHATQSRRTVWASDHLALVAELELRARSSPTTTTNKNVVKDEL